MREQLIMDFFDFTKPCPKEIPMCEDFRQKYQEELNKLSAKGSCSSCQKGTIKTRYMKQVWEQYLATTV